MDATQFDAVTLAGDRRVRGFTPLKTTALDLHGHKCVSRICPHGAVTRKTLPCAPGVVVDANHGGRQIDRCGSWSCADCGLVKGYRVMDEIRWWLKWSCYGKGRRERSWLVTLTFQADCVEGCGQSWRACIDAGHSKVALGKSGRPLSWERMQHMWRRWVGYMRRRYPGLAYFRAVEPTRAGVPHFHVLLVHVGNQSDSLGGWARESWRAATLGKSHIVDVRRTYGDVASYVGGYVSKGWNAFGDRFTELHEVPERARRYSWSNNAARAPRTVAVFYAMAYWLRKMWHLLPGFDEMSRELLRQVYTLSDYAWWYGTFTRFHRTAGPVDGALEKRGRCVHEGCRRVGWLSDMRRANLEREAGLTVGLSEYYTCDEPLASDLDYEGLVGAWLSGLR